MKRSLMEEIVPPFMTARIYLLSLEDCGLSWQYALARGCNALHSDYFSRMIDV
jgi:hypothetical protein